MLSLTRATTLVFLVIFLSACGGDEVTANPNDPIEPEPIRLVLSSSTGLESTLDENKFIFSAPANIIASDTELTFEKTLIDDTNKLKNVVSDLYKLTPTSLTFFKSCNDYNKNTYRLCSRRTTIYSKAIWDYMGSNFKFNRFRWLCKCAGLYIRHLCDSNATQGSFRKYWPYL